MSIFICTLPAGVALAAKSPANPILTNSQLIKEWKVADGKVHSISVKEADLLNQKLNIELSLSETTENIKNLSELIEMKRDLIISRVRYLNQDSGSDLLRNLIESPNPGALERNHNFFLISTRLDIELVKQFNRDLVKLERERQKHSLRIAKLNELHRDLKTQSEKFINEMKHKGKLLSLIRQRMKSNSKIWSEELEKAVSERDSEKINLYQSLLNKNFFDRKGQLTSPTDGNIRLQFGVLKVDATTPALPFHGVMFDSQPGTPVRSIADGNIAWKGLISGLGQTIIIDHGRNLHSVYSRMIPSTLNVGDPVKEGLSIGKVASSNDRFGNGLYFEIRESALPTDPTRWILTNTEIFSKETNQWENVQ